MIRRAALVLGLAAAARPVAALAPCLPGTRPAVLASIGFDLLLPNGDEVTEAQWRTFRADILDPILRGPLRIADQPPFPGPPPRRVRSVALEVRASFNPSAPPPLPPEVQAVMRAWSARFPVAPVEAAMLPACLAT